MCARTNKKGGSPATGRLYAMARNNKKRETESLATDELDVERDESAVVMTEDPATVEEKENVSDGIIRIGEHAEAKKLNKFDLFCLKIWTYIVAFVTTLAKWINTGIFKIFKKRLPERYIIAFISLIIIILLMLLFTAPFKITVNEKETLAIFNNGLTPVFQKVGDSQDGQPIYKWGYADKKGKVVIPCRFENALEFRYGVAFVNVVTETDGIIENYWYLIDKKGNPKGNKKFYYTTELGERLPVGQFGDDDKLAWVYVGGKFGYIGTNGEIKIDALYNDAGDFIDGLARVRSGSQEFFINTRGDQKSASYEKVRDFSEGFAAVKKNELWGFINDKGDVAIETRFDNVSDFYCGYALVRSGSSYGVIDTSGKLVIPLAEFNDIGVADYFDTSWWD